MLVMVAFLFSLISAPVTAQMTDWCGQPLPLQTNPGDALLWRLRCTVQTLDRERAEANDHVTTAEIDKAVAEARLKAVQEQLDIANKKLATPEVLSPEKKK